MFNFDPISILLTLPGIIIALAFHEFAHAFASDRLGDPTPRSMGRLTLSPLAHIDPIGLILIIFARFGWAKPVPINPRYYKKPRRDEILVSVAGPGMNFLLALIFMGIYKIMVSLGVYNFMSESVFTNLRLLIIYTVSINIGLGLFNLLPIPPLDGFHVLANIIHPRNYGFLYKLEQYSTIILILVIVTGVTNYVVGIPAQLIFNGMARMFGL